MNATVAVRPHRHFHWITAVLLVSAIVAAIALTIAVFAGRNDAPATPAGTGRAHVGCRHRLCPRRARNEDLLK